MVGICKLIKHCNKEGLDIEEIKSVIYSNQNILELDEYDFRIIWITMTFKVVFDMINKYVKTGEDYDVGL